MADATDSFASHSPLVSVVIPTYNRAALVVDAVESVLRQSWPIIEIIVADDGSTDDTMARLATFGDKIQILALPHVGRPAVARNAALKIARGEYVAFLDSDDLMMPHKLEQQVRIMEQHPEAALVYADGYFFDRDLAHPIGRVLDGAPKFSGDVFDRLLRGNYFFVATLLVRRSCLVDVGPFDESPERVGVEDYDLWLRLAARYPVLCDPELVAYVRRHLQSLSFDVVLMRERTIGILTDLTRSIRRADLHQQSLHEAIARHHAALAIEHARHRHWPKSWRHARAALSHPVRHPWSSACSFVNWARFRSKRQAVRPRSS
jgi:glycosyltransferase involved in cell wall biosynthesis